jgi:hypothetical protein
MSSRKEDLMPPRFRLFDVVRNFSVLALIVAGPVMIVAAAPPDDEKQVAALVFPQLDIEALKGRGPGVLPILARLYEQSDEARRTSLAYAFYALGWKSPDAKRVLMQDAHTQNRDLRLQVQWALGRVSNDQDVVDVLLANMRTDPSPLFRDKAACALAHDQIHLTESQKVYLFGRLIEALRDQEPQVRAIAFQALQIQTGQSKGYQPDAPPAEREASVRQWERWLAEYRANL